MGGDADGSDRRPASWGLGDEDSPRSHGAALGAGGVAGWWAWRNRRTTRAGIDAVSPMTWGGTLRTLAWFVALIAIALAGPSVLGGAQWLWGFVAVAVMVFVGWVWDRRPRRPR